MRKADVHIGRYYVCKIGGFVTVVHITSFCPFGGWFAVNARSGRTVRIKTGAKLRGASSKESFETLFAGRR